MWGLPGLVAGRVAGLGGWDHHWDGRQGGWSKMVLLSKDFARVA